MATGPETKRSWMGEWMRSEEFWRDVASRTVASVFGGVILGLLASVVAWVVLPDVRPTVAFAVGAGATILTSVALLGAWVPWFWTRAITEGRVWRVVAAVVLVGGVVVWGMLTATAAGAIGWYVSELVG